MKKSITPNQIKQNNRSLIYEYIYKLLLIPLLLTTGSVLDWKS